MAINKCTWYMLRDHPTIIARYINTSAVTKLTAGQVGAVLGLEDIAVSEAVYHRTSEGASPIVMRPTLGRHALLAYTPSRPSLMRPSAGYTFSWNRGNKGPGIVMRRIRFVHGEDKDRLEGRFYRDCKVVEAVLGAHIQNVISNAVCDSASYDAICQPGMV